MSYAPSPRPKFDQPTHIPYETVTRHLWGDKEAGEVADWIYASTDKIHQLMFGVPVGGAFRHSESYRTIFAADEVLYVLQGSMLFNNPETGEVHRVQKGDGVFFRQDTWHHCFNISQEPLRVLEYFAPPPSQGTSGAYAQTRPYLSHSKYTQDQWMGHWPMAQEEARKDHTIHVLRDQGKMWRLEGSQQQTLVGILASTEHLTVGTVELTPSRSSDVEVHAGDECLYLLEGNLNVHLPEGEGQRWFELRPKDGFYIPEGSPHQYYNVSGAPLRFIFGVAPDYFAPSE